MKKKFMSRIVSLVVAGTMVTGMLTACGSGDSEASKSSESTVATESKADESKSEEVVSSEVVEETGVTYPAKEKVKLTIALREETNVSANAEHLGVTPFGEAWAEQTGVEIEVLSLSADGMNLMFAGGELPDIVIMNSSNYPGGAAVGVADGVFVPLNDYMDYAPDYQATLENNDDIRKAITSSDGDIMGFAGFMGDEYLTTSAGLVIRTDWLEELDMEIPKTADQLYEVLKAFKEEKGATVPFSAALGMIKDVAFNHGCMTSPFGLVKADFYQVDGKLHFGYAEPEYKEVLAFFNKLYNEGLLDPNFQTIDGNTVNANFMNGQSGVTIVAVGSGIGTYLSTMEGEEFDCVGFGPLVANEGDVAMSTRRMNPYSGYGCYITSACENIEAAMNFLNYGYTEEGHMLFNFGIEGVSYEMVDGEPVYTELITNNPDGWTMAQALAQYCRGGSSFLAGFVQDKRYFEQYAGRPQQQQSVNTWIQSDAAKYAYPSVIIAEEDADEEAKLFGDIYTYFSEMQIKFITGEKSLDVFESEYLATLEKMGIDRVLEIRQAALDEFNAR